MTTLRLKSALAPEKLAALFPGQKIDPPPAAQSPSEIETKAVAKKLNDLRTAKCDLKKIKQAFPVFAECKPLAIGIFDGVKERFPDKSNARIGRALNRHTKSIDYLREVAAEGAIRHNLAGEPVEPVSQDHRAWAVGLLAKKEARADERPC
jgi:ProP effector